MHLHISNVAFSLKAPSFATYKQLLCQPKRIIIFGLVRILRISVLLLGVNLLLPTVAFHFLDVESGDVVCEFLEDFGEEEEEDGETSKALEDTFFFRDWYDAQIAHTLREQQSSESYPENNNQLRIIHLEVQTPPPQNTLG